MTDAGDTTMRWNRSRCTPVKWAIAALIGSACDTTTISSPGWSATTASSAATMRTCISVSDSPSGKRARDGLRCTVLFIAEVKLHPVPGWLHEGIGLVLFAAALGVICVAGARLRRETGGPAA